MKRNKIHGRTALGAVAAILALTLSACSSSDGTGASGGDGSGAQGSAAEVNTLVEQMSVRPTEIPFLGPTITSPIPTGKTIAVVNCGAPACIESTQIITDAANVLGWKVDDIKTDGSPEQTSNAWTQILRDKPTAAISMSSPMSQIGTYVKKAKASGTAVVGLGTGGDETDLIANIQNDQVLGQVGTSMGEWVADQALQSKDKAGDALFINFPDAPVLQAIKTDFGSALKKYCEDCGSETLDIGLTGLQSAPDQTISYLRAHPNVKFVAISALNVFDAIAPAVHNARMDVKIIGAFPTDTSKSQIKSGVLDAAVAAQNTEQALAGVDAIVRHVVGQDDQVEIIRTNYAILPWLLTKDNLPATGSASIVENTIDQYKASWGK